MNAPTWLIPACPLIAFTLLLLMRSMKRRAIAWVGVTGILTSFLATLLVALSYAQSPISVYHEVLWQWMSVTVDATTWNIQVGFYLDALSLLMVSAITFVAFLIAIFSAQFMDEYGGYSRFFALLNLFVASMLILVLADNFLLLYAGWEGVGVCSYLLIGFWYEEDYNRKCATKAFLITRIGDVALLVGIIVLAANLGTLDIQNAAQLATEKWALGSMLATLVGFCLLGGAVGKSAQLPLQTWLPDAMVGPTPASALIHAATMVTAGVYLIARANIFFSLAPSAQMAVMVVGALTLLIAGSAATVQTELKKVLAYSTVSQIGYMFLALGVGAYSAAMFHFMTHAFFKALLFLGAGVIGYALHHETNMLKMGGLKKEIPILFWTFLIGSACLMGFPLVTSGFYSKELILSSAFSSSLGGFFAWACGSLGVLLTSFYTTRMVCITFLGDAHHKPDKPLTWHLLLPLVALSLLSLVAGFVQMPHEIGGVNLLEDFLRTALPQAPIHAEGPAVEWALLGISVSLVFAGIAIAYYMFAIKQFHRHHKPGFVTQLLLNAWYFDAVYDAIFVKPYIAISRILRNDVVAQSDGLLAYVVTLGSRAAVKTQSGHLRHYLFALSVGVVVVVGILVLR